MDEVLNRYGPQLAGLGAAPDAATQTKFQPVLDKQDGDIRALLTPDQQKIWDRNKQQLPPPGR